MAPVMTGPKHRGRKRKNDEQPTTSKNHIKSIRREEEKENHLNKSASTSPISSIAGSSRESSNPIISNSRRKNQPIKLENIETTLKTTADICDVDAHLKNFGIPEDKKFLVRNVVDKRLLYSGKAVCRRRPKVSLKDVLSKIENNACKTKGLHTICFLNFSKISCWGTSTDADNFITSAASVQSFMLLVDDNNVVSRIDIGLSVIPMTEKSLSAVSINESNMKHIMLTSQELKKSKSIYFAVIVRRKTSRKDRRGAPRKAARSYSGKAETGSNQENFEQVVRFGCILVYNKEINLFDDGIQRMILLNREETPEFRRIFGEFSESGLENEWMSDARNLEIINQTNNNKQDSHLARLIFSTDSPDFDGKFHFPMSSPVKPRQRRASSRNKNAFESGLVNGVTSSSEPEWMISLKSFFPNLRTTWNLSKFKLRLASRFPCYELSQNEEGKLRFIAIKRFFDGSGVTLIENSCFYRWPKDRSIPIEFHAVKKIELINTTIKEVKNEIFSARNRAPGGQQKYGLDFVQTAGHLSYMRYIYKPRSNALVPQFPSNEPVEMETDEVYPVNNAFMLTDVEIRQKVRPKLPDLSDQLSEMKVLDFPVTQAEVDDFNERLVSVVVKDPVAKHRKPNPKLGKHAPGVDIEGRPIPTFSELFFPEEKTELYNLFCRHFYAEAGHRPGNFSGEWKSRIMAGFIMKFHQEVFDNKLSSLFEKQLQLIAATSADWKSEYFDFPLQKYRELKKIWRESKQRQQSSL